MAILTCLGSSDKKKDFKTRLCKAIQSSHINFLIGSGASFPVIPLAGGIEKEIDNLNGSSDAPPVRAKKKKYEFLVDIQNATIDSIDSADESSATLENYRNFLGAIEDILAKRNNPLLPRKANLFTTNYDLLIEKASEDRRHLILNDGFTRASSFPIKLKYDTGNFFTSTYNMGNLYNYRVEIPSLNLLKLHGSLSWKYECNDIEFNLSLSKLKKNICEDDVERLLNEFAVIFPERGKHKDTVLTQVYYDLLRIYSNALEKENSLLLVFGFSFADEHIYGITRRALKNPTLQTYVFAYTKEDGDNFKALFESFNNVEIVVPSGSCSNIDFGCFNSCLDIFSTEGVTG